jgi:hypothetical protein
MCVTCWMRGWVCVTCWMREWGQCVWGPGCVTSSQCVWGPGCVTTNLREGQPHVDLVLMLLKEGQPPGHAPACWSLMLLKVWEGVCLGSVMLVMCVLDQWCWRRMCDNQLDLKEGQPPGIVLVLLKWVNEELVYREITNLREKSLTWRTWVSGKSGPTNFTNLTLLVLCCLMLVKVIGQNTSKRCGCKVLATRLLSWKEIAKVDKIGIHMYT